MPRLIVTEGAVAGLERCRLFLHERDPQAAVRAGQAIVAHLILLDTTPQIGRPLAEDHEMRELVIPFGDAGYIALYRFDPDADAVYLLAFRHQR